MALGTPPVSTSATFRSGVVYRREAHTVQCTVVSSKVSIGASIGVNFDTVTVTKGDAKKGEVRTRLLRSNHVSENDVAQNASSQSCRQYNFCDAA
jgi:hypothetical protein